MSALTQVGAEGDQMQHRPSEPVQPGVEPGGSVPYQLGRWQAEHLHPALGGDPQAPRFEDKLKNPNERRLSSLLYQPPKNAATTTFHSVPGV